MEIRNEIEDVHGPDGETVIGRLQWIGEDGYVRAYVVPRHSFVRRATIRPLMFVGCFRTEDLARKAILGRSAMSRWVMPLR